MLYPEFGQYISFVDDSYPLINAYKTPEGHIFYVEPGFYVGLMGFKEKRGDRFEEILQSVYSLIEKNDNIIFTATYDFPMIEKEGFIYREIGDISDALNIYVEDKSRGSDYGD